MLLASTAQAVDFKNNYRGMEQKTSAIEYRMATTATAPTMGFQSTSAYSGQWSQDTQQSMLNADGSVNAETYGVGWSNIPGMRKDPSGGINPPDEDDDDDVENGTPLSDGLWVLLAMAMIYACARSIIRKRTRALEH